MSLNTLGKIRQRLSLRPAELEQARQKGAKVIGWFSYNIPEELIYAYGLIPVRLGAGGDDRLVEVGSRYISTKNCVFVRETVGLFAENKNPYIRNIDAVAFDGTCLQTYRTAEVVEYYFDIKTLIIGVPRNFYWPEAKTYFFKEVENFSRNLADIAGTTLSEKALAQAIELYNNIRTNVQKLSQLQAESLGITWEEVQEVIHAGYSLDRREYLALLQELILEVESVNLESSSADDDRARIFLSGSVLPPGDTKLINIISQVNGRIVGDDLWSGFLPNYKLTIGEPSLKAVADAYLDRPPHGALPYLDLKSDVRLKNLKELIELRKAEGVIYHTLRYCDPFTFKAGETKEVLKADNIPLLEIHTEYAGSDYEAIRTRVEAFVELINKE